MKRNPRTFLEYLIRKNAALRRDRDSAYKKEARANKKMGCADDREIYRLYETSSSYATAQNILSAYLKFKKEKK